MGQLHLDLKGLKCPLPVLKTRKALMAMQRGERLLVTCTDAMAVIDIPHLVRENGDRLEEQAHADGVYSFSILKS